MYSNRTVISQVMNGLGAVNADEHISKRYIYSRASSVSELIIKNESTNPRLFKQRDLFTSVKSLDLEPYSGSEHLFINVHPNMQRSKKPIPRLRMGRNGAILNVYTVTPSNMKFQEKSPLDYSAIVAREFKDPFIIYYWFEDKHLVFPDCTFHVVKLEGMFVEPEIVQSTLNECDTSECTPFLDLPFICPDYLIDAVVNRTIELILAKPVSDQIPDGNAANRVEAKPTI